jgi:hypothetical protein
VIVLRSPAFVGTVHLYSFAKIHGACFAQLIRDVIEKQTGVKPPELPPPPVTEDYGAVELVETATLLDQLHELFPGDGIASEQPDVMEEYGQS